MNPIPLLSSLESAGLVHLIATQPDLEYAFRHTLIQDVAYASLTRKDRRRLHGDVGTALEQLYPNRLDELAPILAKHFDEAGEISKAFNYYVTAARSAQQIYANPEAVHHYLRAIEILESRPAEIGLPPKEIKELYLSSGRVLELSGRFGDAEIHYAHMRAVAHQSQDTALELAALIAQAAINSTPTAVFNPEKGDGLSRQALELARFLDDPVAQARILWTLLLAQSFMGNTEKAREYGEASLALARQLGSPELIAYALNDLSSFVYLETGDIERCVTYLSEAVGIWRQTQNLPMLSDGLTNLGTAQQALGDLQAASHSLDEALQISRSIDNTWGLAYTLILMMYVHTIHGYPDKALEYGEEGAHLAGVNGFLAGPVIYLIMKSGLYSEMGDYEAGERFARQAQEGAKGYLKYWMPMATACLAYAQARSGNIDEAQRSIRDALDTAYTEGSIMIFTPALPAAQAAIFLARGDCAGMVEYCSQYLAKVSAMKLQIYRPDGLYYLGRAQFGLGQFGEARRNLEEAEMLSRALETHRLDWRIYSALADVETALGNQAAAENRFSQARQAVQFTVDHTRDPDLQAHFLAMPDVRRFLSI